MLCHCLFILCRLSLSLSTFTISSYTRSSMPAFSRFCDCARTACFSCKTCTHVHAGERENRGSSLHHRRYDLVVPEPARLSLGRLPGMTGTRFVKRHSKIYAGQQCMPRPTCYRLKLQGFGFVSHAKVTIPWPRGLQNFGVSGHSSAWSMMALHQPFQGTRA